MSLNPVTFTIENDMLIAQASGELSFEDIINHYKHLDDEVDFYIGISAIYDFSKVDKIQGDISHFEKIAADMGDSEIVNVASYVAIIVNEDNSSMNAIFNAYCKMVDFTLMNAKVFHHYDDAFNWLKMQG